MKKRFSSPATTTCRALRYVYSRFTSLVSAAELALLVGVSSPRSQGKAPPRQEYPNTGSLTCSMRGGWMAAVCCLPVLLLIPLLLVLLLGVLKARVVLQQLARQRMGHELIAAHHAVHC